MSGDKQLSFAEIMPEYPWEGQSAQEVLVDNKTAASIKIANDNYKKEIS